MIHIQPGTACVNPVFELTGGGKKLTRVALAERDLSAGEFAWDGQTLWLRATLTQETPLRLEMDDGSISDTR